MNRTLRTLTLPEIGTLLEWAAAEGWNPGLGDAAAFQAADPDGFIGAFVDGVMVAAIAAVAYDEAFGFIGLYICHRDWRGQGHGKAVWDAGMSHLGNRTIGLDGVPEQQANYAGMGFVGLYETVRMSGVLRASARPMAPDQSVAALDRRCFPAGRSAFLQHWLAPPDTVVAIKSDGYAVQRPCRDGSKIGPLFAADTAIALELLAMLDGPVQIDIPATQTGLVEALAGQGFTAGFRTARMYRGRAPAIAMDCVFGITSLELG